MYNARVWSVSEGIVTALVGKAVLHVPVCTERNPRHRAFYVSRLSEEQWVIAPAFHLDGWACPGGFDNTHRGTLYLTNARPEMSEKLSLL